MKPEATKISVEIAGGKQLSIETGKLAKQAGGSAVVRFGENVVLAAATSNPEPRTGIDFFPLTVDYREYTYAGGRIPGGFIKREGRMSEREVLTSRQIDRPVRPMFAEGFKCETQVIAFVLSADNENDPDVLGINAASAALTLSDIPFLGPIGAVRVGLVHGSAIFTRGETQALVTTTLGTSDDMQRLEGFQGESKKRFMLHYNFPPFSVGEVAFMRGAGRREIGHGALADRAISAVLPTEDKWPYAMRVVSDILESNGSSSMATVCGASISLMDAGVPLKAPVAGVAMGLVKEGEKYAILSDIAGAEDHYGDMDFKVAGTKDGITALQMDIKVAGITPQIMREALAQAQRGRLFILGKMDEVITEGRVKVSAYAPRIYTLQIPVDKIRDVIGPGGKMIRSIIEQTGVKIDVEDSGKVNVASNDEVSANKALQIIRDLTASAEVGKTYLGKVSRLADFGAFVEILPGLDGLLHISEVAEHRIKDVRDELKEGDQVLVKVLAVEGNRIKLSRKAILKEQRAKMGGAPPPPDGDEAADAAPPSASHSAPQGSPTAVIEGGADFDADDEPNFNRVDGVVASVEAGAARPEGTREGRPSGGGGDRDRNRRRRGRGRGPGGGPGGGHGGGHSGGGGRGRR